ncbi:META domain-containing protein [Balneolaceae bacterium YR4-1]|uniref:META domain-containing protein n=1 Tax=Halalkalibaculum roseum TaxID=2709311 RepID=A0A6M1T757_9BACT|nr:META domain-containing protein [Halalkalibaculum roseum]NGP77785.1 META domain-containing protein [Halalkalibaculum roseum]
MKNFKNYIIRVAFTYVILLPISGCSLIENNNNENTRDLLRAWELATITDETGNTIELFDGEVHTLRFSSERTLGGETACNFYGGDFSAERDGNIRINNILTTEIACEQPNHSPEYLSALGEADEFSVHSGRLVLRYGNAGELIFEERLE